MICGDIVYFFVTYFYCQIFIILFLFIITENHHMFKPIFHCDAKPFTLGTFALPNANIPTCWYLLRWVMQIFRIT